MLIINRLYIIIFLAVYVLGQSTAQISFVEEPYQIDQKSIHSGEAMGFADLNGDGLDDLIVLDDTRYMYVHFQTLGQADRFVKNIGLLSFANNWSVNIADVDGNGIQDIFTSGPGGMRIHMGQGILPDYVPKIISHPNFLSQGSNFADMDQDGDLDLFVCDDDAENFIAYNDGNGNFSQVNNLMDFTTIPASDGSGNYGSLWTDFDRDGDLDLYIAKCRGGAQPGDPRRTNQFFLNTDTGFVRLNDHPQLLSNDQSWTADFIDIENDGDWDLLVANHYAPMNLFIQQADGSFVDEAEARGIAFEAAVIQLVSADFDNDGDVDVFVTGGDHILFENDGNGYFINGGFPEGINQIESATCGDINNDGYLDIYGGYSGVVNRPTVIPDRLFINHSDGNNFVKFSLRTSGSNSFAIGATVELYQSNKTQLREIRSGESYGINTSNIVHFGTGVIDEIDSVKIYWPSGAVEVHELLLAGLTYQITEGGNVLPIFNNSIRADKKALCIDDTVTLSGPLNGNEYRWSTGETTSSIKVTEPGVYVLRMNMAGEWLTLPSFQVMMEGVVESRIDIKHGTLTKCRDDLVLLSSGEHDFTIVWNNGNEQTDLAVSEAGFYHFEAQTHCGVSLSDTVEVINYLVTAPTVENDTVPQFGSAVLTSSTGISIWVLDTVIQDVIWIGQELFIDSLDEDSLVYTAAVDTLTHDAVAVGVLSPDTTADGYHINTANATIDFTAKINCILDEVTVFCRMEGPRTIVIHNSIGVEILRKEFSMNRGCNILTLGAQLDGGSFYHITTDSDENIFNFGFRSPEFMRSVAPVVYPFTNQLIEITGTDFPSQQYYYFYNWQVRPQDEVCHSNWVPVHAVVDGTISTNEQLEDLAPTIFPNPTRNSINIYFDHSDTWERIELYSENGLVIRKLKVNQKSFHEIDDIPSGLYLVKLTDKWGNYNTQKVIVLE